MHMKSYIFLSVFLYARISKKISFVKDDSFLTLSIGVIAGLHPKNLAFDQNYNQCYSFYHYFFFSCFLLLLDEKIS